MVAGCAGEASESATRMCGGRRGDAGPAEGRGMLQREVHASTGHICFFVGKTDTGVEDPRLFSWGPPSKKAERLEQEVHAVPGRVGLLCTLGVEDPPYFNRALRALYNREREGGGEVHASLRDVFVSLCGKISGVEDPAYRASGPQRESFLLLVVACVLRRRGAVLLDFQLLHLRLQTHRISVVASTSRTRPHSQPFSCALFAMGRSSDLFFGGWFYLSSGTECSGGDNMIVMDPC